VLSRTHPRPQLDWADRAVMAALIRLLRGRRGLHRPPRPRAGVRGQPAARPLGQGDRGARSGGPGHGGGAAVFEVSRRVLRRPPPSLPGRVRRKPDRMRRALAMAPASPASPPRNHDHVRDTTTGPPSAGPRPRSGTTARLPARRAGRRPWPPGSGRHLRRSRHRLATWPIHRHARITPDTPGALGDPDGQQPRHHGPIRAVLRGPPREYPLTQ
jgi:hypothetical protein